MRHILSPNFEPRRGNGAVHAVVLHYTAINAAETLARLCDPAAKCSAHYLIDKNGEITQLVSEDRRAWHAGLSFWRGESDINSHSIGIELENAGALENFPDFPPAQIGALKRLLAEIYARHALAPDALLSHAEIAPRRKRDPGPNFPWPALAAAGFGLWPERPDDQCAEFSVQQLREDLHAWGFAPLPHNMDAPEFKAALRAFQQRYEPEVVGRDRFGTPTPRTHARLKTLLEPDRFRVKRPLQPEA